jgi:hypothetical protein
MTASVRLNATRRRDFQCESVWDGDRAQLLPLRPMFGISGEE